MEEALKLFKIEPFGSGWAVFKSGKRITPALDHVVAKESCATTLMTMLGFMPIYNPYKRTVEELYNFFHTQQAPCTITVIEIEGGRNLEFVK